MATTPCEVSLPTDIVIFTFPIPSTVEGATPHHRKSGPSCVSYPTLPACEVTEGLWRYLKHQCLFFGLATNMNLLAHLFCCFFFLFLMAELTSNLLIFLSYVKKIRLFQSWFKNPTFPVLENW